MYLADIVGPMALAAFGLGFALAPVTIAAVTGISEDDSGLASGLINTSQQVGGALGLAVLATIANTRTLDLVQAAHGDPAAPARRADRGLRSAFWRGPGSRCWGPSPRCS